MKTSPRLLEILVSARQLFSMEPVRQLFNVLQVIFRRIYIYIKDFIVNEFIPLIVDLNNFEVREEKIRPVVDLTEEENDRDSVFELPTLNHPRGDASTGPEKIFPRRKHQILRKSRPYCISTDNESSRSTISAKTTQSQHSQPVVIHPDIRSLNPDRFNSWIVRRTRSGQIYGKYPI
ncbi:uncharacterized protein LOC123274840 isoform X2 [Cotesia glomerata]|uniref:uncharacterized protein LOC123274840 isoform X2 n=1 Tax=Cotesia glomerata TaxID=32391 RepID=UPI001D02D760|nr:uncharacterized protein LOC123274840 isoform X2 [Cotesia glomerata]